MLPSLTSRSRVLRPWRGLAGSLIATSASLRMACMAASRTAGGDGGGGLGAAGDGGLGEGGVA